MKLVAAALAISVTGCSFALTNAPNDPPQPPSCNDSYLAPVGDVIGVFVGAPMLGLLAWSLSREQDSETEAATLGITMAAGMLGFTISAIVGFSRVSRCNDATDAYRGEMMMRNSQPRYAPPPYYPAEPPAGTERGLCRADATCDPGLTCASNRCVMLPPSN